MPTIVFPTDRIVGEMTWGDESAPATGVVEAPDDDDVALNLTTERDADLSFLYDLPGDSIHSLFVYGVIGETFAAVVQLAPGLRQLFTTDSGLDDQALPFVSQLVGLRHLELIGNRFTDAGLQQLRVLRNLEFLCLEQDDDEPLSVAALDFARDLPNLKEIEQQDSTLTQSERAQLAASLPGVKIWY
jgi:hypothetical protein